MTSVLLIEISYMAIFGSDLTALSRPINSINTVDYLISIDKHRLTYYRKTKIQYPSQSHLH